MKSYRYLEQKYQAIGWVDQKFKLPFISIALCSPRTSVITGSLLDYACSATQIQSWANKSSGTSTTWPYYEDTNIYPTDPTQELAHRAEHAIDLLRGLTK